MKFNNRRIMNKFSRIIAGVAVAALASGYNYFFSEESSSTQANSGKSSPNLESGKSPSLEKSVCVIK